MTVEALTLESPRSGWGQALQHRQNLDLERHRISGPCSKQKLALCVWRHNSGCVAPKQMLFAEESYAPAAFLHLGTGCPPLLLQAGRLHSPVTAHWRFEMDRLFWKSVLS